MAFLYEKSRTWRLIVANSKASPAFFAAFSALCVGVPIVVGAAVMNATNPGGDRAARRSDQFAARARNQSTAAVIGEVNKRRLEQLLKEVHEGADTEDRYRAALKGETMTGTPGARTRGVAAGTSVRAPPLPPPPPKGTGAGAGAEGEAGAGGRPGGADRPAPQRLAAQQQ